ncbi:uncharacterized protein LOC134818106 [Bolinopsis microptera]|uniref:uncharacterized protein LOC134818106 n=1 Tax=Bolinopsis microptera TaxID=2820187 RepID=UPI003079621D
MASVDFSSGSLSPSMSRIHWDSSRSDTSGDSRMNFDISDGPVLLILPDLSVPSILRSPARRFTRFRVDSPQTPSFNRMKTSCCRITPDMPRRSSTPSRRVGTPRSDCAPRTGPLRQFPSPLFCSSPTRPIPLCLGTPASTPHCPSPIRIKLTRTSDQSYLEDKAGPLLEEDECVVRIAGRDECVVRIAGRRLFESGCSLSYTSPVHNRSKAKDQIGLLTFILDTECSKHSADLTPESYSDEESYPSSYPSCSRLIDATQDSVNPKKEKEEVSLSNSCNSLLAKYPHLFSSMIGSGDRSPAQSSPVGTGQNLIRDTKRKREGLGPDLTLHDAKKIRGADEKKQKLKSLLTSLFVKKTEKRKQRSRLVTPYRSSAHIRSKV